MLNMVWMEGVDTNCLSHGIYEMPWVLKERVVHHRRGQGRGVGLGKHGLRAVRVRR